MQDFKLSDFMDYYHRQLDILEHIHMTAMNNLHPLCKDCLRQSKCWDRFWFKDLCLYENNKCLNRLEK